MKTKALSPSPVYLLPLTYSPFLTASFLFPLTSYHLQLQYQVKNQVGMETNSENRGAFGKRGER